MPTPTRSLRIRRAIHRGYGHGGRDAAAGGLGGDTTNSTSLPVVTYPGTNLAIRVYIALGADPNANPSTYIWTDITAYVLWANRIVIKRGRQDEQSEAPPSSCALTLKNFAIPPYNIPGIFSPRNPAGPWFGQFGRNTPLRVDIDPGTGARTRFIGFVPSWPLKSDTSGKFKYVSIVAEGITRRLGQGSTPIRSAVVRGKAALTDIVAFWPMEDGAASSQFASYFSDQQPLVVAGTPTRAADGTAKGTLPLPTFALATGDAVRGYYTAPAPMSQFRLGTVLNVPTKPSTTVTLFDFTTDGTAVRWTATLNPTSTPGRATLQLQAFNSSGTQLLPGNAQAIAADVDFYAIPFMFNLAVVPTAGVPGSYDFAWFWVPARIESGSGLGSNGAVALASLGSVTSVGHTPDPNLPSVTFGMASIHANGGFGGVVGAISAAANMVQSSLSGFNGGFPTSNLATLCAQEGVPIAFVGTPQLISMGPWAIDTFLNVARQSRDADNGVLTEHRTGVLTLYVNSAFTNQAPDLTLDNALGQLSPDFTPIDDDQLIRNDVTVTRINGSVTGSFSRQVQTAGSAGTGKAGKIDTSRQVNTFADYPDLAIQASYRLVHGTVDESRYPSVKINFARLAATPLISAWLACDIGARIRILHPPADQPPDDIDQVLEGYTESFDQKVWDVDLNLSPFSPHRIFRSAAVSGDSDEFLGYAIPETWMLNNDMASGDLTLFGSSTPSLSIDSDDWYGGRAVIRIDGEKMIINGAASGMADTFTRVVAGGWGTADSGQTYDANANARTDGTTGLTEHTAVPSTVEVKMNITCSDFDFYLDIDPVASTGAGTGQYGMRTRVVGGNYLDFRIFDIAGSGYTANLHEVINNAETQFDPVFHSISNVSPGDVIRVRISAFGRIARMKAYRSGDPEPTAWLSQLSAVNVTAPGYITFYSSVPGGWTNPTPFSTHWDNLTALTPQTLAVTRGVLGTAAMAHTATSAATGQPTPIEFATPGVLAL